MLVSTYYLNVDQPWRNDANYTNTAASFRNMLNANGIRITADLLNSAMFVNVDSQDDAKVNSVIKAGAFNAKLTGWRNDPTAKVISQAKPAPVPVKPSVPNSVSSNVKDPKKQDEGGGMDTLLILAGVFFLGRALGSKSGGNKKK